MKHLIFILVFFCSLTIYAQIEVGNNLVSGTVDTTRTIQNLSLKSRAKVSINSLVFNVGYQVPWLTNAPTKANFWNSKAGTDIDFSIDYRRQFQKKVIENDEVVSLSTCFAFGVGVGVSFIHKATGFDNFSETLTNYVDVDNDICNVMLNYKNVKESFSLTYLDIPLYLEIGKLGRIKPGGYFKLGVKASVLVGKSFATEGSYTAIGYYPKTDVTIHDVPILGYYTNAPCYDNPEQNIAPFVLWGIASAGINIPFSSFEKNRIAKWILRISANVDFSLTPISKELNDSYFKNAAFRLNQVNILSNNSRIFSAGVLIGVVYCL